MSHLILHIGLHKTGTSSVQQVCFAHADLLARHGVIYPRLHSQAHPQGVVGHHGLTLNLARAFPQYMPPHGSEGAWAKIIADHAKSPRTVLISSEEFSRGREGFRVDMARLGQIARAFDKVTVVCVLREQISFVQSICMQMTSVGGLRQVAPLIHSVFRNDTGGLWTDWRPLLDHLLTGFPAEDLHFIDYSRANQAPGGVVGKILHLAGITYRPGSLPRRVNASAPPLAQLLCLPYFPHSPLPHPAILAVDAQIKARFGADRPTTLFTRPEVAAMTAHFAAPNRALVERIRHIQPDFDIAIPSPPDTMLYREDVLPFAGEMVAAAGIGPSPASSR